LIAAKLVYGLNAVFFSNTRGFAFPPQLATALLLLTLNAFDFPSTATETGPTLQQLPEV